MVESIPDLVSSDTTVDSSTWLKAAQQSVRSYCGWHIAPNITQTLKLDSYGARTLLLPSMHVTDISSLMINGVEMKDDIDWSTAGTVKLRKGCFPDSPGAVTVTLKHGFDAAEVADVTSLMLKLAQRGSTGPGVIGSQSTNGSSVTFITAGGAPLSIPLLQIEKDALQPYKLTWGVS
jgi:hypothetical protein